MLIESSLLLIIGFLINCISAVVIIRGIYYPKQKDYSYIFTFIVFNTLIYFVMELFTSVELSIGVGFGLFALFSVLRYRTETVPIREMTYLFVMVALPVLNSVFYGNGSYGSLLISNVLIISVIWVMEKGWCFSYEEQQHITYERIDLIHSSRRAELYADLMERTGHTITGCDILHIDYLHDTAELLIRYSPTKQSTPDMEQSDTPDMETRKKG
ncbi:MAG TPA: DUF4956 domain-containing protein [Methanospirillum sp.]|nr:DUF4956 domain-containing protein [Methanospirillum sp.]